MKKPHLVFLKLGGSLLGDKCKARSFRAGVVERVGGEIARVLERRKDLRLLLAHGGGGAHHPAAEFHVRQGLPGGGGWQGFTRTRRSVLTTNCRVLDALARAGLNPVLVPPVAGVVARNGKIVHWDTRVIEAVLSAGQVPLIHGDVVLDGSLGFTIAGTEEMFAFLAPKLRPSRVVLACDVGGVYVHASECPASVESDPVGRGLRVVRTVRCANIAAVRRLLRQGSGLPVSGSRRDVTGGMLSKVDILYGMTRKQRTLEARIVSGLEPGAVEAALLGDAVGTAVTY